MTFYVLGFMFNADGTEVVLIRKKRPVEQAGLCNGVGGKVEPGETFLQAMTREFKEETGVNIPKGKWEHFATLQGKHFEVRCFSHFSKYRISRCMTNTDETVVITSVNEIRFAAHAATVNNVRWLIPMALDHRFQAEQLDRPFTAVVHYP